MASNVKSPGFLEMTAVKIVNDSRVLGSVIGNEKSYEIFRVSKFGKSMPLLLQNVPSKHPLKRLGMPSKTRATKIGV